jgi:type IV pilus assembly protein PilX
MILAEYRNLHCNQVHFKRNQSGVVLFVALVSMVVMSLAAVALIRSVDTNNIIAGNLSYKQTATISSSFGIENVADTLGIKSLAYANSNDAANGYYATCKTFDAATTCDGRNLTADASWVPGVKSRLADGIVTGITGGVDAYGNTIQYIVERMCNAASTPDSINCLLVVSNLDISGHGGINEPLVPPETPLEIPLYRVTVRIAGPKNTISYIQAFIS